MFKFCTIAVEKSTEQFVSELISFTNKCVNYITLYFKHLFTAHNIITYHSDYWSELSDLNWTVQYGIFVLNEMVMFCTVLFILIVRYVIRIIFKKKTQPFFVTSMVSWYSGVKNSPKCLNYRLLKKSPYFLKIFNIYWCL